MAKLAMKQAGETMEGYLAEYPNATTEQIGEFLGIDKRGLHNGLKLLAMNTSLALLTSCRRYGAVNSAPENSLTGVIASLPCPCSASSTILSIPFP